MCHGCVSRAKLLGPKTKTSKYINEIRQTRLTQPWHEGYEANTRDATSETKEDVQHTGRRTLCDVFMPRVFAAAQQRSVSPMGRRCAGRCKAEAKFALWAYVIIPEHVHLLIWPRREKSFSGDFRFRGVPTKRHQGYKQWRFGLANKARPQSEVTA